MKIILAVPFYFVQGLVRPCEEIPDTVSRVRNLVEAALG